MENIKILKNTPSNVLDAFNDLYNSKFKRKRPQDRWSDCHAASTIEYEDVKLLSQLFPLPPHCIELYFVTGMIPPHVDRGRKTALQIPIQVDINNSFTYSVRGTDLTKLSPARTDFPARNSVSKDVDIVNNPTHWFYKWDESLFDKYNLEFPILQNVSLPHGGANYSRDYRIFFSVSYKIDYNEVCSKFSSWI